VYLERAASETGKYQLRGLDGLCSPQLSPYSVLVPHMPATNASSRGDALGTEDHSIALNVSTQCSRVREPSFLAPVGFPTFRCAVTKAEQLSSQSGAAARAVLREAGVPEPSRPRPLGWFGPSVLQLWPLQICSLFGFRNKFRVVTRNCTDLRESAGEGGTRAPMTQTESRPPLLSVGNVLLVCNDADAIGVLTEALQQFALSLDVRREVGGTGNILAHQKFEAVIVDLELGEGASTVLREVRLSSSNQTAVTFTITGRSAGTESGFSMGSMFKFDRPLSIDSVSVTLKAAYGLIVRERRRYFRCPVAVGSTLRTTEYPEIKCETVNIGEGGMGLTTSHPFKPREQAMVQFTLPGQPSQFSAELEVCWCDQSGCLGVRFLALSAQQKSGLREWLSARFEESLPERVAIQFRKSAAKR
jgi:hypothetical protein